MSDYKILPYSNVRAEQLGVKIVPSHNPNKKIDVLDYHNNFICSIGDINYNDFPNYVKNFGLDYGLERRRLYHIRHQKEKDILGSPAYYAKRILW